jgi:hypothetical protein
MQNINTVNWEGFVKRCLLTLLLIICCYGTSSAAENYTIDTKSDNFFENIVYDTMLLLDSDLRKTLAPDMATIVEHARFTPEPNSWKPRISPRGLLTTVYSDTNSSNIKENFSSLIKPVVEMACVSQQYDPMNNLSSKCVKDVLKYPVTEAIRINYSYTAPKSIDQYIEGLSGLNNTNRYQQIVRTMADLLNSAYDKSLNKGLVKNVIITKRPLVNMVAGEGMRTGSRCGR